MAKVVHLVLIYCLAVLGSALTPSSYLTTIDKERLQRVFEAGLTKSDIKSSHYSILGLSLLGKKHPKETDACTIFKSFTSTNTLESWYHATSGAVLIGCQVSVNNGKSFLESQLNENAKIEELYQAVATMKNLNLQVDSKKVKKLLDSILAKDSSASVQSYALHIATLLTLDKKDLKKYFDEIEDVVQQADESDGAHLFYDNGLFTTAFVIDGIYQVAEKYGEAPKIPSEKVVKFANFLLSRRHTYQIRAATYLTMALKMLSTNKFQVPVSVTVEDSNFVHAKKPNIMVRVSNLWGDIIDSQAPGLLLQSAKSLTSDATFLKNEAFKATKTPGVYEMNLIARQKRIPSGFYQLIVDVQPKSSSKKWIALTGAKLEVKVTSEVTITNVEMVVKDREQNSIIQTLKLSYPKPMDKSMTLDPHQKIILQLSIKEVIADATVEQTRLAQQLFVRLTESKTNQEIIFVAEPDKQNVYSFNLDVTNNAKEFNYQSGSYSMEIIVGDALIENSINWKLGTFDLSFPAGPEETSKDSPAGKTPSVAASKRYRESVATFGPKAEIHHQFRLPDKRASNIFAYTFTGLCAVPLLLLIVLWGKLGVNLNNFPGSLCAFGFHIGLITIFLVYFGYWFAWDMFTSLKYVFYVSLPTFFCGNRLLRTIAAKRQKS